MKKSLHSSSTNTLYFQRVKSCLLLLVFLFSVQSAFCQWQPLEGIAGGDIAAVLAYGDTLYAASDDFRDEKSLYRSLDNGKSFFPIKPSVYATSLARVGSVLLANGASGLLRSVDGGKGWQEVTEGLNNTPVTCFAVSKQKVYAGTNGGGVKVSSDYGKSWQDISGPLSGFYINSLLSDGNNVYAGVYGALYHTSDGGATWTNITNDLNTTSNYVLYLAKSKGILYAAIEGNGVYASSTNGQSWQEITANLLPQSTYKRISAFSIYQDRLFVATDQGLFRSADSGKNWQRLGNGLDTPFSVKGFAWNDTYLFAATDGGGVYRSSNGGDSWQKGNQGLSKVPIIDFEPLGDTLFAATEGGGVHRSIDKGQTWLSASEGLLENNISALHLKGNCLFAATIINGVFRSCDGGQSWERVNKGFPQDSLLGSLPIFTCLTSTPTDIYAGTFDHGIFHSTDNGNSWMAINLDLPFIQIASLAATDSFLFAATSEGNYRLASNANSWEQINDGIEFSYNNFTTNLLSSNDTLYVSTESTGVYRSTDQGESWQPINDGLNSLEIRYLALINDLLIASTSEQGVYITKRGNEYWIPVSEGLENMKIITLALVQDQLLASSTDKASLWKRPIAELYGKAPQAIEYWPADDETDVSTYSSLVITFDQPMQAGEGNIKILQGIISQEIPVSDPQVSIDGNNVYIIPTDNFYYGSKVIVQIDSGAFKSMLEQPYAGIRDSTTWNFVVGEYDSIAPIIFSLSPEQEAKQVSLSTDLTLAFDEDVFKGSGNIVIKGVDTTFQTIPISSAEVSISGSWVTIDSGVDLPADQTIFIHLDAGIFTDINGNSFEGITGENAWVFHTLDTIVPTLVSLSPPNQATEVATDSKLVLTFNEKVLPYYEYIVITHGETTQYIYTNSEAVTVDSNVVTIQAEKFPAGETISVYIPYDAFVDEAYNSFAGLQEGGWIFSTKDEEPPLLTGVSPADESINVPIDANLIFTFDEAITKGAGNIILVYEGYSQTIDVTDAAVSIDGSIVTVNPPDDFPSLSLITVQIQAGAFKDLTGNPFAGIAQGEWSFTTVGSEDLSPPLLTALFPDSQSTGVEVDTELVLTFDEPITRGNGSIILLAGEQITIINVQEWRVNVIENEVLIDPPVDFPMGTEVTILIQKGTFTDLAGNPFAGITNLDSWIFTTETNEDVQGPIITELSPANGATNVSTNADLVLTFDEPIVASTGSIIINQGTITQIIPVTSFAVSISENTVTIDPDDFPTDTFISITIPEGTFTDEAGNEFAGIAATDWSFTTQDLQDETPPMVSSFSPADEATNVAIETNLVITFDEAVVKGTGNIIIMQGATSQAISVTDAAVTVNGTEVTINPPVDFPFQTDVSIQIPAGAFTDLTGNEFAGIIDETSWNFTTEDTLVPLLITLTPANGATEVTYDADLVLTFDEPIIKGTGMITLTQGSTTQVISVTDPSIIVIGNVVSINPADFPPNVTVSITIPQGAFTDESGNAFTGISGSEWQFTTQQSFYGEITRVALVNADTDQILMDITEGMSINLMDLPTMNVNLVAYSTPSTVGSVLFNLDGATVVENFRPYAIGGDGGGHYKPWMLPVGIHTLTVTPYSEATPVNAPVGNGIAGTPYTLHFSVTGFAVQSLILVNADTDEDIQPLHNGDVIDLSILPTSHLNIRAVTNPMKVGRVMFNLDGAIVRENHYPYSIGGDLNGDFRPWTLPVGEHLLKATPFDQMGGGGNKGVPHQVAFTVIEKDLLVKTGFSGEEKQASLKASPNPFIATTTLSFRLPEEGIAKLDLFDIKGVWIASLFENIVQAGKNYQVNFEGKNFQSGVYIGRLSSQKEVKYIKLIIAR